MMEKQWRKTYISLAFVLLWLCALSGTASSISTPSGKAGNYTYSAITKATAPTGLLGEEELSRTFFSGDIKLLPSGLPAPEFAGIGIPSLHLTTGEVLSHNDTSDLRHQIEQLIFPFHFFY
ncbi:hypothetical protein [Sinomicrobium weinanense]|uniref:Uncharacterized protein n=1 Tax=Sinomicrobium weinanense TaxID=2842200 RepID=A0A926JNM7_9FLAO|nr:hypothetical protein [Sinomicrobium weinanense]MBC9794627.1 hypothetical protein [Sinomicrobium weinanense]MBU3124112.1 hypothetical protein [Sinomicrobium weinanense]